MRTLLAGVLAGWVAPQLIAAHRCVAISSGVACWPQLSLKPAKSDSHGTG
ncbi:hypothetical protein [Actinopolymorpha pittospori]